MTIKKLWKNEDGSSVIGGVITFAFLFTILYSFIFGGYSYFTKASENMNLNYDVGRYVSKLDMCDIANLSTMKHLPQYSMYNIEATIDGTQNSIHFNASNEGTITVSCSAVNWKKGEQFGVGTTVKTRPIQIIPYFSLVSSKGAIYVAE